VAATVSVELPALSARIKTVRERIEAANGDPDAITIVAVTKGFGAEVAAAASAAGLVDLGETYAQELLAKSEVVDPASTRWHFIGHIQRNKIRKLAPVVALWQTIDREEVGAEVARRQPGAQVLVQVNTTAEPQKAGCDPGHTGSLVSSLTDLGLDVRGLMTIGPQGASEAARPAFRMLRRLADDLGLPERSMGMSGDLEAAVAEGSTMVRVGNALFGDRPTGRNVRK
jgi:pyridoxal phosphate enzyme (YggS family)